MAAQDLGVSLHIKYRFSSSSESIEITEKGLLNHRGNLESCQSRPLSEEEMQQLKKLVAQVEWQVTRPADPPMKALPSISVSLSCNLDGRKGSLRGARLSRCPPEKVLHGSAAPLVSFLLSLRFAETSSDVLKT